MRLLFATVLLCLVSACSSTAIEEPVPELEPAPQVSLYEVETRLASLQDTLVTQFIEVCRDKEAELREQLQQARDNAKTARREVRTIEQRCATETKSSKLMIGEVEDIELIDQEVTLEARIDTGAETSSLGVFKITKFERDGKDWVKFKLKADKESPVYEYPVFDTVRIKLRDEDATETRYEIKLDIKMGKKKYRNQVFNLSNRRHLDYQVLIGQSFLRDIAIVDVSTKHELKRK